jgi:hypothetical protein
MRPRHSPKRLRRIDFGKEKWQYKKVSGETTGRLRDLLPMARRSIGTLAETGTMKEMLPQVVSGFAGAFFAFLFMRLADAGKSIVDRQTRHLRALGSLEILFSDLSIAIQENLHELENFRKAFAVLCQSKRMVTTPNRPEPLEFRDDAFSGLGNTDFLNEIMSFRAQVRGINGDIVAMWGMHEKFREAAFNNPNRLQDYIDNFALCDEGAQLLLAAHSQLLQRTMRMQVVVRILYRRDRTMLHRITSRSVKSKYPKDMNALTEAEGKKLAGEIKKSLDESKQRIGEMLREQLS